MIQFCLATKWKTKALLWSRVSQPIAYLGRTLRAER